MRGKKLFSNKIKNIITARNIQFGPRIISKCCWDLNSLLILKCHVILYETDTITCWNVIFTKYFQRDDLYKITIKAIKAVRKSLLYSTPMMAIRRL